MKSLALSILFLLYPVIVFFGLQWLEPKIVGLILVTLALVRFRFTQHKIPLPFLNIISINVIVLLAFSVLSNSAFLLKLYPVLMNVSFLSIFTYSLFKGPAAITIIARLREELTEKAITYTEKVTWVWCGFFLINGTISLWTVYQSEELWLWYNGLVSYILMGLLFAIEWLVRIRVKKNDSSNITS